MMPVSQTNKSPTAKPQDPVGSQWTVFALFFVSGATALIYQIPWVRSLTLTFGASHEAVGIVLAAFMGGLALGGFVFGRLSERVKHPLRVYGWLEIGIGIFALVLPSLLRLVDGIYVSAALKVDGVSTSLQLMRVALAFVVLLLPTFLMGGTLPLLAVQVVSRSTEFGRKLSQLYAVNTLGAVAGALLAGFVLLPILGVQGTEWVGVGLNMVIGCAAIALHRRQSTRGTSAAPKASTARRTGTQRNQPSVPDSPPLEQWALRLAVFGTAISGLVALALEVMWTRAISVAVGQTTYSFTVMLAAFLLGIGLGSGLHSLLPWKRFSSALRFGVVLAGVGIASLVVSQNMPRVPMLAVQLGATVDPGTGGLRLGTTMLTSFVVMLVPCILMGMAFPLAGEARAKLHGRFGRSVGDVVALNTLGAIAGSLLAAYWLVPHLGLQRGMLFVSALDLCFGLVVVSLSLAGRRRSPILVVSFPLLAAAALALPYVLPGWNTQWLATFVNNTHQAESSAEDLAKWRKALESADVLYYKEGERSNISVVQSDELRAILVDGKSVASDSVTDMQHELLLGHLPVLMHPNPRTAAVVGLGAGITLGAVLAHPGIEHVVLIEIEPAVLDGARLFTHVNHGAVDDERLEVAIQDGRNYLRTTATRFDLITADPIHPWARGASYLYTSEYFAMVSEHLTPGGVMCQWLPLYELSGENIRSVIASFSDNYPYTTLWQTAYDGVLLGSDQPLSIDVEQLERRLQVPSVRRQLAPIGLDNALSLLAELTLNYQDSAAFGAAARRNTDDNLYLEFSSPLSIGTDEVVDNIRDLDALRPSIADLVPDPSALVPEGVSSEELFEDLRAAKSVSVKAQLSLQTAKSRSSLEPYPPIIESLTRVLERVESYGRPRSLLSLAWLQYSMKLKSAGRPAERLQALTQAVASMPLDAEANYQLGTALAVSGQARASLQHFETAIAARPVFARAHANYGSVLIQLQRFDEALLPLRTAVKLRPTKAYAWHSLAQALFKTSQPREAHEAFRKALRLDPELDGLHHNFALLLVDQRSFAVALETLEAGLKLRPQDARLQRLLAWLLAAAPDPAARDGARALQLAERVNRVTAGKVPQVVDTLAAALAEVGRWSAAAGAASEAADLAQATGQPELAAQIRERAAGYRARVPYRL